MKRLVLILALAALLALAVATAGLAQEQDAVGSCPPAFDIHHHHDMEGEPMHHHIGTSTDLNGDGWICVMHATEENHVHTDNNLPLP